MPVEPMRTREGEETKAADLLWAKGLPLDAEIHRFTVDEDPLLDSRILPWDIVGSAGHVRMLAATGLMPGEDAAALLAALETLHGEALSGELVIQPTQEDGHTALEQALIQRAGPAGRRVHLGRSRNDQVILAVRLYLRDALLGTGQQLATLAGHFSQFAGSHLSVFLPGYTHMRRAMPSSLAQWALAFAEGLNEELETLEGLYRRLDRCPLGAAAGFGVPLAIDREYSARVLGFRRLQRNPVDVNNSRGRHELAVLQWLASVAGILEKYLWDLALFSTEEYGFLRLPDAFTTGSSIMPQKRNPDVVELARGRCGELRGLAGQLEHIAAGLPSSYHRDSQLLKAPLLRGISRAGELFQVMNRLVPSVRPCPDRLAAADVNELYAAHEACHRAADGMAFRDAYGEVASELLAGDFNPDRGTLGGAHTGSLQQLGISALEAELAGRREWLGHQQRRQQRTLSALWQIPR
ncbi:argininosuccinate lyase [Natronospira bacteriovora]|uniref:argininosuccinate lyase n=1 Tax=Natronospira bacteriovora TaxID=3069753 RepID=A0ABU0W6D7_9GAMM|nr:argininosuccinate lyase [Natronospira sp. AB-CW4]MDQ2069588.1 argininosuccinate lyase [Natronospira sp. AB-CW4]